MDSPSYLPRAVDESCGAPGSLISFKSVSLSRLDDYFAATTAAVLSPFNGCTEEALKRCSLTTGIAQRPGKRPKPTVMRATAQKLRDITKEGKLAPPQDGDSDTKC